MAKLHAATRERLQALAKQVVELEWGSEEQINAENEFGEQAMAHMTARQAREFEGWCLKATSEERVSEALRILGVTQ